MGLENRLKAV